MNEIPIAPPAGEPVTLVEAKAWLRMDTSAEDDLIATLIAAARRAVEAATRRALMHQTSRVALDVWPFSGDGARSEPIVVNIHAQDADSFRKSEGQVAAALARAVARGPRGL